MDIDESVASNATANVYDEEKKVISGDHGERKKQTHLRCERQRREAINVCVVFIYNIHYLRS